MSDEEVANVRAGAERVRAQRPSDKVTRPSAAARSRPAPSVLPPPRRSDTARAEGEANARASARGPIISAAFIAGLCGHRDEMRNRLMRGSGGQKCGGGPGGIEERRAWLHLLMAESVRFLPRSVRFLPLHRTLGSLQGQVVGSEQAPWGGRSARTRGKRREETRHQPTSCAHGGRQTARRTGAATPPCRPPLPPSPSSSNALDAATAAACAAKIHRGGIAARALVAAGRYSMRCSLQGSPHPPPPLPKLCSRHNSNCKIA